MLEWCGTCRRCRISQDSIYYPLSIAYYLPMLYHFSEEPDIARFAPRAPLAHPQGEPLVWTIDQAHAPLYFFPRDCPRVAFWPLPTTTSADRERFYTGTTAQMVIAIEYAWLARVQQARLYRYHIPAEGFTAHTHDPRQHYGAFVSRAPVLAPARRTARRPSGTSKAGRCGTAPVSSPCSTCPRPPTLHAALLLHPPS